MVVQRPCFSRCARQEQWCSIMSDFTLLAHNTRHDFDLWCPQFAQVRFVKTVRTVQLCAWLLNLLISVWFWGNLPTTALPTCGHYAGVGMEQGELLQRQSWFVMTCSSGGWGFRPSWRPRLDTQAGLSNVSQSMLQLVSSEKEACSDASSLLGRLF